MEKTGISSAPTRTLIAHSNSGKEGVVVSWYRDPKDGTTMVVNKGLYPFSPFTGELLQAISAPEMGAETPLLKEIPAEAIARDLVHVGECPECHAHFSAVGHMAKELQGKKFHCTICKAEVETKADEKVVAKLYKSEQAELAALEATASGSSVSSASSVSDDDDSSPSLDDSSEYDNVEDAALGASERRRIKREKHRHDASLEDTASLEIDEQGRIVLGGGRFLTESGREVTANGENCDESGMSMLSDNSATAGIEDESGDGAGKPAAVTPNDPAPATTPTVVAPPAAVAPAQAPTASADGTPSAAASPADPAATSEKPVIDPAAAPAADPAVAPATADATPAAESQPAATPDQPTEPAATPAATPTEPPTTVIMSAMEGVDLAKGKLSMAMIGGEDPKWFIFSDGKAVAQLQRSKAAPELQSEFGNNHTFVPAFHAALKSGLTDEIKARFGFAPITYEVPIVDAVKAAVDKEVAKEREAVEALMKSTQETFKQCANIALMQVIKGFNVDNTLRDALVARLEKNNVRGPASLIDASFAEGADDFVLAVEKRIVELMQETPAARNAVAKLVEQAKYQYSDTAAAVDDGGAKVRARLENGAIEVVPATSDNTPPAPIQATASVKKDPNTGLGEFGSKIYSIVGGRR